MEDPRQEQIWFEAHRDEVEIIRKYGNCTLNDQKVNNKPLCLTTSSIEGFDGSFDSKLAFLFMKMLLEDEVDQK